MESLSALDLLAWDPEYITEHPAYAAGNALGWLYRGNKQASTNQPLSGRLYLAKSGWLLLSVPNALVRGVFDALTAPGAELPTAGAMNLEDSKADLLNAHISVMTADEVASIGADKINERGHMFGYALGALKEITANGDTLSKIWTLQVSASSLSALRKSYGLSPTPKDEPFHITVAVRRKNVLRHNSVSKGNDDENTMPVQASSRGELKAASQSSSTGKNASVASELSRSGQNDLLHGGKADNVPDREFSSKALNEGQKDERKHTDNDQIAKEIAKDHLSQDPRYYKKEKLVEKLARPQIIEDLLTAKNHSDNKRYGHKSQILKKLMEQAPQDWQIDDSAPKFKGITHTPTKFKFHTDPSIIPTGVKAAFNVPGMEGSVYGQQLAQSLLQRPLKYDYNRPVFENVQNHLQTVKQRGDFILQAQQNQQRYRASLDPQYRYQLAMQAFRGNMPGPSWQDQMISQYGDGVMGQISNWAGRPQ
ncbi:hypothetical protein [Sphingorhabdus sp.]|uniref:hypothetical protein n=1 Tax=Sphingorhabdus sp. TaxID=1902408 RepID=UPI003340453D